MHSSQRRITRPVLGVPTKMGDHCDVTRFRYDQYGGATDPLLMVDHFRMRAQTFGPHPHNGISAVTYVFEDSRSAHLNHDSLGNDGPIHPGSLHWMVAGSGVIHDEWPGGENPESHGLQFFVNLPAEKRDIDAYAVHLESEDVPIYESEGVRIRVVAGRYGDIQSPILLPQKFTLLDCFIASSGAIRIPVGSRGNAWIYSMRGSVNLIVDQESITLDEGYSVAIYSDSLLSINAEDLSQVVVMYGEPVGYS